MSWEQSIAKSIGFDFQYTRCPRDLEPTLSTNLGIPGYEKAPLQETDAVPETKNRADQEGYVAPGLDNEFSSFFNEISQRSREDGSFLPSLTKSLDTAFDAWEEERSSEVVYRTDGMIKFLPRVSVVESSQTLPFIEHLAKGVKRFRHVVENDPISVIRFFLDDKSQSMWKLHPLTDVICCKSDSTLRLNAMHAGWVVRLTFMKLISEFKSSKSIHEVRILWTTALTEFLTRTLREVAEPVERSTKNKKLIGRGNLQVANKAVINKLSTKQMTSKVNVNEKKLEVWDYVLSIALFHFENDIIDRSFFLKKLLFEMQGMHGSVRKSDALPLFMCYFLVRMILSLAPYMALDRLHAFWILASANLRTLYWTSSKADNAGETIQSDPAFFPFSVILQDAVDFIQDITPESIFESWERDRNAVPAPPQVIDSSGSFPVQTLLSRRKEVRKKLSVFSSRSRPNERGKARVAWAHVLPSSRQSGKSEEDEYTDSGGQSPSGGGASRKRLRPNTPNNTTFQPPTTPGLGTFSSTATSSSQQTGNGEDGGQQQPSMDPWRKFELISNTESLHELLKNAKKVLKKKPSRKPPASFAVRQQPIT